MDSQNYSTLMDYTYKMSAMAGAGVSLAKCNVTISEESIPLYAEFCSGLQKRWADGDGITLSVAMAERPDIFPSFYTQTVNCGEVAGKLELSFAHLAEILEVSCQTQSQSHELPDWNKLDDSNKVLVLFLFNRNLSDMLGAGVPILKAIETASEFIPEIQRPVIRDGLAKHIREGNVISSYISDAGFIPPFMVTMVRIGEEEGSLDLILDKVADVYQKRLITE